MVLARSVLSAARATSVRSVMRPGISTQTLAQAKRWQSGVTQPDDSKSISHDGANSDVNPEHRLNDLTSGTLMVYNRPNFVLTHGKGSYVWDSSGRKYLDLAAGIAVNSLGHCDPDWQAAVIDYTSKLCHVSNLFHSLPSLELANSLVDATPWAEKAFLCNSGTEAVEGALKFARKRGFLQSDSTPLKKTRIVCFDNAFHGRSMGALSVTANAKYRDPFEPMLGNITRLPCNDQQALADAMGDDVCAIILEPVQGEGGVLPIDPVFIHQARELADQYQASLIVDEIQCGVGRTGYLWAHSMPDIDVKPDIMVIAKPLANGLPIGAILVNDTVADCIKPGDHGSTYAGGPLVCAAGQAVFSKISQPDFLSRVRQNGDYFLQKLMDMNKKYPDVIEDVRGKGLMLGMQLKVPTAPIIQEVQKNGVIIIGAGTDVLRFVPPLTVSQGEIDEGLSVVEESLAKAQSAAA
eukprot:Clim_evm7s44 gene=Clim_evmTU7s44